MVLITYHSLLHNCIYLGRSLIPAKNLINAKKLALLNYNIILHYIHFQRCMVFKKQFCFFFQSNFFRCHGIWVHRTSH